MKNLKKYGIGGEFNGGYGFRSGFGKCRIVE